MNSIGKTIFWVVFAIVAFAGIITMGFIVTIVWLLLLYLAAKIFKKIGEKFFGLFT